MVLTKVVVSSGIVMSVRMPVRPISCYGPVSVDGHVPQNSDAVNAKLFADLPVLVCSCLVVAVDVFSFSQFRTARDQVVNCLIETATQSTFWVHVRRLEDVVLVPVYCRNL